MCVCVGGGGVTSPSTIRYHGMEGLHGQSSDRNAPVNQCMELVCVCVCVGGGG